MGTFWWSLGYTPPAPSASTRLYRVAILFLEPLALAQTPPSFCSSA